MATIDIQVPDIGDFDEVTVIELMVKVGDTVKAEQSLITVESDKASMEIPSSHAGVVKELKVALGDKVKQGSLVVILEGEGAAAGESAAVPAPAATSTSIAPAVPASVPYQAFSIAAAQSAPVCVVDTAARVKPVHNPTALALNLPHASPSLRKFARELGVP